MKARGACVLLSLLLTGWPWVCAARQGQAWKAYYVGTLGTELEIQAELEIHGTAVSGSYFYPRFGIPLALTGTLSAAGKLTLEERDTAKKPTGKWQGTFTEERSQATGTWMTPDSKKTLPFALTKVAEYVRTETSQGERLFVATSYPYFLQSSAAWQQVNSTLQEELQTHHKKFMEQTQKALQKISRKSLSPLAQELYYSYKIAYYTPHLISLLATVQERTGDDRRLTGYASMHFQLHEDDATLLKLTDFFLPDSPYLETLSTHCKSSLQKKAPSAEALARPFQGKDLQAFTISPMGLTFAFAPYQFGGSGEEGVFVTVPYKALTKILRDEGPHREVPFSTPK